MSRASQATNHPRGPGSLIDEMVRAGDVPAVHTSTCNLTESERRNLAQTSIALLREAREASVRASAGDDWPFAGERWDVVHAAQVFVLATVTPAQLRAIGAWALPPDELAVDALTARDARLAEFVDVIASLVPTRFSARFSLLRALIHGSKVDAPAHPGYILLMIVGIHTLGRSIADALRADPGLLEHEVWRLFEVEGDGEASLAAVDKYTADEATWASALTTLAADGTLPRARLLDESLAALRRDFAAFRAGWFSRFHERLEPTAAERQERMRDYLALLGSPVATTVSFAVRALVLAGGVPDDAVSLLTPALHARETATVKAAIKLLPRSQPAALLAAEALGQAPRGSQLELLGFVERVGAHETAVTDALARARPYVAPALRERVVRLLPAGSLAPEPQRIGPTALRREASARVLASPVETTTELIELLARVLEAVDDPYDLERAIDGVSRLCERTEATLRQLMPLARRATTLLAKGRGRPFTGTSPRADIAGMVLAWANGEVPATPPPRQNILDFLSSRVFEVATRAARGVRQPILSLPTMPGCGIDTAALGARRAELRRLGLKPADADALQAALRAGEVQASSTIRFVYESELKSRNYEGKTYTDVQFHVRLEPPLPEEVHLEQAPELFFTTLTSYSRYAGAADVRTDAVRWMATVWPSNREPYYATGAAELGANLDWWEARWHVRHFLEPLLLPTEPIQEMGGLLLALGLCAKEPGERTLARDVLLSAVTDRRLDPLAIGRTLGRLYARGVVKGARIAASLSDAARVSSDQSEAVAEVIEHLLAALDSSPPADLAALLSVLSDCLAQLQRGLRVDGARAYLAKVSGSGKAARLARALTLARA